MPGFEKFKKAAKRFKRLNADDALVHAITVVEREYGVRVDSNYPWFTLMEQIEELKREAEKFERL